MQKQQVWLKTIVINKTLMNCDGARSCKNVRRALPEVLKCWHKIHFWQETREEDLTQQNLLKPALVPVYPAFFFQII